MFKKLFSKPLEAAKDKVNNYVNLRLEEVKLSTIEKLSPIVASVVLGVVIISLLFLLMLFLGLSLAGWLGTLLNSVTLGHLAAAGIFLLLLLIFLMFFKAIKRPLSNVIGRTLFSALSDDDDDDESEKI